MEMGPSKSLKKRLCILALIALLLFLLLNVMAYRHARAFFFYTENGQRTLSPEELSWQQKASVLVRGIHVPKPKAHTAPGDFGMPFRSITVPGRDGLALGAWLIPHENAASTVVMFHGYSSEKSGLLPEAKLFHEMGHELVLVDFPGSGESPGNMTSLGIHEADDVAAVIDWARTQWPDRQLVVYGHSMGGAAIMRAIALRHAKPDAAIVESVFDTLLDAIRFRFRLMSVPSFPSAEMLLFWGGQQLGENGFDHDVVAYGRLITLPVMMLHGERDNRASLSGAKQVHAALAGEKELMVLPEAGHVNPCLSDPAAWQSAVAWFIRDRTGKSIGNETP